MTWQLEKCRRQFVHLLTEPCPVALCGADATVELPESLAFKGHKSKPSFPSVYKLERPIDKPYAPDQENPVVFYDVW